MPTRQYIGARYVPKIATPVEWQNNTSYEALTIVTYNNNSYTSRKPVPAGVRPTNSEYWAVTGNYNAQVEQYRQEVEELAEQISGGGTRKIIFIGDSYALDTHGNWTAKAIEFLPQHTCYAKQRSGAGFLNGVFLELITEWYNENTALAADITDIVVVGGANDSISSLNGLPDAMRRFVNYCSPKFPKARLRVGFIGWVNPMSSVYANRTPSYQRQAYSHYANKYVHGMDYLGGVTMVIHDMSLMDVDGIHPTLDGGEAIANAVIRSMFTGFATVTKFTAITPTVTGTLSGSFYQSLCGDVVFLRHTDCDIQLTNEAQISNSWVDLLDEFVCPYTYSFSPWRESVLIRDNSDGIYKSKNVSLRVSNGKLQIALYEGETTSTWVSIATNRIRMYNNWISEDAILATT